MKEWGKREMRDLTDGEIGRNGMDGWSEERGTDMWGKNEGTEEGIAIISRLRSSTFLTKKFESFLNFALSNYQSPL